MTENSEKTKNSKHAIASLILGLTGSVIVFAMTLFFGDVCLGPMIALAGIITGIVALVKIHRSRGLLKGRILAIIGIFAALIGPVLGVYTSARIIIQAQDIIWQEMCQQKLAEIAKVLKKYNSEYEAKYPPADQWCEVIVNYSKIDKLALSCPTIRKEQSNYAINPNCKPNSPPDTVLLFETKGGWNQQGGPELLTTENHKGKGSNILFNDGTVKFVGTEELETLKWKANEPN